MTDQARLAKTDIYLNTVRNRTFIIPAKRFIASLG